MESPVRGRRQSGLAGRYRRRRAEDGTSGSQRHGVRVAVRIAAAVRVRSSRESVPLFALDESGLASVGVGTAVGRDVGAAVGAEDGTPVGSSVMESAWPYE